MKIPPLRLAYGAFALLGAGVVAYYLYDRGRGPDTAAREPAPVAVQRPIAAPPASGAPTVPVERPNFVLKDPAGKAHTLADWDGKSLVINFWATWCAPCRREIPLLNRIHRDYADEGVEVIGIAVDFADDVHAFLKDFPIEYPLLMGEEDGLAAARSFGVESMAFPFTAFTDAKGRILSVHLGELHAAQVNAILGVVSRVNSGELTPATARPAIEAALKALPAEPAVKAAG